MQTTVEQIEARESEIRTKRIATLVGAYELMCSRYREVKQCTRLNDSLVAVTVEDYLRDRQALINRHNITGRIQRHKIAGLMAASIAKNRPIQLVDDDSNAARLSRDNEVLAVLHGLAVCTDGESDEKIKSILRTPFFDEWFSDFVYLLHRHPSNTESFILIFGTLAMAHFPTILHRLD